MLVFYYLCSLDLLPHFVNVLIAPRKTRQNQKSTKIPRSSRVGSRCCAAIQRGSIWVSWWIFGFAWSSWERLRHSQSGAGGRASRGDRKPAFSIQHSAKRTSTTPRISQSNADKPLSLKNHESPLAVALTRSGCSG